jgi:hypothetical protein
MNKRNGTKNTIAIAFIQIIAPQTIAVPGITIKCPGREPGQKYCEYSLASVIYN